MKNTSVLSCEHIHLERVPGKTETFARALTDYLRTLFGLSDEFGSAEIIIETDGVRRAFVWDSEAIPEGEEAALDAILSAWAVDVRVNMCCDLFFMDEAQTALTARLADGSLRDCVRYCALLEDEQTSSLFYSGLFRGAFLHGSVPFETVPSDRLPADHWNGRTQRAEFTFPAEAADGAQALADRAAEEIEGDFAFADDGRALVISEMHLVSRGQAEQVRQLLEQLCALSEQAVITGALTPEDDETYALLRYVRSGDRVEMQAATAEAGREAVK